MKYLAYWCLAELFFILSTESMITTPNKILIEQKYMDISWVARKDWEARPPLSRVLTTQPASYVVISHIGTSSCSGLDKCCKMVQAMQTYQMKERGYEDIGYNFFIGADDRVYEGRGWGVQPDEFYNYKNNSISVTLIGNFNYQSPADTQFKNLKNIIIYGVENGNITKDYILLGHKQFVATDSPGQVLYDIKKNGIIGLLYDFMNAHLL